MLVWQARRGHVQAAFSGRAGGVSIAPYDSLNLAMHVGDDPRAVSENRARLATALGVPVGRFVWMQQVHGAEVAVVDDVPSSPPAVDALVTARPGVVLAVLVADCVPLLLADPDRGVVAAAHAGRAGLHAGVVPAVLAAMDAAGARHVHAWVGPSVCGACYEVPAELRAQVAGEVPESFAWTRAGTPALDLAAGVSAQLRAAGVDVTGHSGCTREQDDWYSYRRDGRTGRFAGLVWTDR